jgi:putative chitinase
MITPLQLKKLFPACRDPNAWCRIFTMELPAFGITDNNARLAAWLAQCGYESQSFNTLRESGSYGRVTKNAAGATVYDIYTEKRLMELWPRKFPTLESTQPYIQNPEGLMNYVYANMLGNGASSSRDGTIYRGGGLIQITGRANYRQVGQALGLNLESMPKMIEQPAIACRTSGYFWKLHDLNTAADAGDFEFITKKINPALQGEADRVKYWEAAKTLLAVPAIVKGPPPGPAPNQPAKVQTTPGKPPGPVPAGTIDGVDQRAMSLDHASAA